ncbi:hypothetical protein [Micromonospora cremea]|nr:hypothetical protein [Micromonospora cremea]
MSIAFLDEALQRSLERGAPSTVAQLITLRAMYDAGLTPPCSSRRSCPN